jgi:hypothetical protein
MSLFLAFIQKTIATLAQEKQMERGLLWMEIRMMTAHATQTRFQAAWTQPLVTSMSLPQMTTVLASIRMPVEIAADLESILTTTEHVIQKKS